MAKRVSSSTSTPTSAPQLFEAEIAPGIESIATQELAESPNVKIISVGKGFIQFHDAGTLAPLLNLKTINAVYLLKPFPVPRPKALLGHQNFYALLMLIQQVLRLHPVGSFRSLTIDAAGSDSSVMQRLKAELAHAAQLAPSADKGDLLIRLRPSVNTNGWDALVRISPRPLATRAWRVHNYEGALNASVAHAIIRLTTPTSSDTFLNLCSGSGTLLIERVAAACFQQIIGVEIASEPLHITRLNLQAAQVSLSTSSLLQADARELPLAPQSVNKLCADLPFGQLKGSHAENLKLYPAILHEAARVAHPNALFVVITHEIKLMDGLLSQFASYWKTEETLKITLNGLHPRIYVLRRTPNSD